MRILLSPAKKMNENPDAVPGFLEYPAFLPETEAILARLREMTYEERKAMWKCNDAIAGQNADRLAAMDLKKNLTPAILAYEGIAYQYMAPGVFSDDEIAYVQEHLRILSAFYGVVRPLDGVTPYRLEMEARCFVGGAKDLYSFWGRKLYDAVRDESGVFINLASKEYAKCIETYLTKDDRYLTIIFCEAAGKKLVTRATYAKMARGEMVRFMAENSIEDPKQLKAFDRLGHRFREDLSSETELVFERIPKTAEKDDF